MRRLTATQLKAVRKRAALLVAYAIGDISIAEQGGSLNDIQERFDKTSRDSEFRESLAAALDRELRRIMRLYEEAGK